MVPPTGDGGSPASIDRLILKLLQTGSKRRGRSPHAAITDASGHFELQVVFASSYYPASVDDAILTVRWYTNDDFTIHYREVHSEHTWDCRWDRHPPQYARPLLSPTHRPDAR